MLLPEIVLAHAIVERAAAIQSLEELRKAEIEDLEVCYNSWTRRVMGQLRALCWRVFVCCRSVQSSDIREESQPAQDRVDLAAPRVKWTLTHSYFANMGGLRVEEKDNEPVFSLCTGRSYWMIHSTIAITTRQFSYLRRSGLMESTLAISEEDIKDKSKTDYFTKGLAIVQISSLILSLVQRSARHLAISQLEIITVAFAVCATGMYSFAWNKPQGVITALTFDIKEKISGKDACNMMHSQPAVLLDNLRGEVQAGHDKQGRTLHRVRNGNVEITDGSVQLVPLWLIGFIILFSAIHLSAWNFEFPSAVEKIMWRLASTVITGLPTLLVMSSAV